VDRGLQKYEDICVCFPNTPLTFFRMMKGNRTARSILNGAFSRDTDLSISVERPLLELDGDNTQCFLDASQALHVSHTHLQLHSQSFPLLMFRPTLFALAQIQSELEDILILTPRTEEEMEQLEN